MLNELPEDKTPHPLLNPTTYELAIKQGILDAPGLKGSPIARGRLHTQMIEGACCAVDENGEILSEFTRLEELVPKKLAASEEREKQHEKLVHQIA